MIQDVEGKALLAALESEGVSYSLKVPSSNVRSSSILHDLLAAVHGSSNVIIIETCINRPAIMVQHGQETRKVSFLLPSNHRENALARTDLGAAHFQ